jgi:hypothetical protein
MADTSTYRVATTTYAWGTEVIQRDEVRPAADAAVVANVANWTTLDSVIAAGRWAAHPFKVKV